MSTKYLFTILLLCLSAEAQIKQTFRTAVVAIVRDDISVTEQLSLYAKGISRLPEASVNAKVTSVVILPDVLQQNSLEQYSSRLRSWSNWYDKNFKRSRYEHVHFLLPPVVDSNGSNYGGGVAGAICTTTRMVSRKYSYSIMRLKSDVGEDRREHSSISALHETLHNLGANHKEIRNFKPWINVMHPDALSLVSKYSPLPILRQTKTEVEFCRKGKSPLGRAFHYAEVDPPFS